MPSDERKRGRKPSSAPAELSPKNATPQVHAVAVERPSPAHDETTLALVRTLRELHVLLRSARLYERQHPRMLQSLDTAYESLRRIVSSLNGLEIRVERAGLVAPSVGEEPLPDPRGDLYELAKDLQRAGVQNLTFAKKFHVGELDTLAQLAGRTLLQSEHPATVQEALTWWPKKLLESRAGGISANTQTERKVDAVLSSLVAALVAFGGSSSREASNVAIQIPQLDDLIEGLRLLARLTPPLEAARGLSPEEAARSIHGAMEQANRDTVNLLLGAISQYAPRQGEQAQAYLLRLSESLVFEFLGPEFSS